MARGRHHIVDAVGDQQPGRDAHGRLHQEGFPQQAEHRGRLAEVRDIRAVVGAETEGVRKVVDPLELGWQLDAMRRYVPVVLPLTMLFGALAAVTLPARVSVAKYRLGLTLATGALLVGLVARPSVAVVGQPLWDDALAQTARVAQRFPPRAVVLMSPDLAGTHLPTSLAYLHDVDTILLQPRTPDADAQVLPRVIRA